MKTLGALESLVSASEKVIRLLAQNVPLLLNLDETLHVFTIYLLYIQNHKNRLPSTKPLLLPRTSPSYIATATAMRIRDLHLHNYSHDKNRPLQT